MICVVTAVWYASCSASQLHILQPGRLPFSVIHAAGLPLTMFDFLSHEFLGNTFTVLLISAAIGCAAWLVLIIVRRAALAATERLARKSAFSWNGIIADCLKRTHGLFLLALAVFAASRALTLSARIESFLSQAIAIVIVIQVGLWVSHAVALLMDGTRRKALEKNPAAATSIGALGMLLRSVIWVLVALLILANAGIEIAPLIAGLGIGGLAVALAVQTVLKDLLASVSILFDKPFVIGDFLMIDDLMGSVENIGIKTTRIRSLSGEQLVFSNNDLLESRIRNFGRMRSRRVVFPLGVIYQTPREKLTRIPGIIKDAIESQPDTRFDRSHLEKFGDFSIDYETVYFVAVPDFNTYMDVQQSINLRIHEQFEKEGIEFAYPTQTLFLERSRTSA